MKQKAHLEDYSAYTGEDATPIKWARQESCGHKVVARVGETLCAIFTDGRLDPVVTYTTPNFMVVEALPGECPVCDGNTRTPVRDSNAT